MYGKLPFAASSVNSTVASSIAFAPPGESTPVNAESAFDLFFGSAWRSMVATTSAAVSGVPSWNVTPFRIANVHTEPSPFGVQLSAMRGSNSSWSLDHARYSPDCPRTARPPSS